MWHDIFSFMRKCQKCMFVKGVVLLLEVTIHVYVPRSLEPTSSLHLSLLLWSRMNRLSFITTYSWCHLLFSLSFILISGWGFVVFTYTHLLEKSKHVNYLITWKCLLLDDSTMKWHERPPPPRLKTKFTSQSDVANSFHKTSTPKFYSFTMFHSFTSASK